MNRTDLGERLGQRGLRIPRAAAVALLDAVFDEVAEATCRGEVVRVHRFGRLRAASTVQEGPDRTPARGTMQLSWPRSLSASCRGAATRNVFNQEEPAA